MTFRHDSPPAKIREGEQRVLVIEDDQSISVGLRINLEAEGYAVLTAEDGERGLELARTTRPDLIILDVMLPKQNGLEVLSSLRKTGYMMPIIILSARTAEMDKVTGLELGAEDYVAKPFSLAELLARVRAALRRGPPRANHRYTFGDIVVDAQARSVTKSGKQVEVTVTEFDLLLCLIEARGRAVTRESIFRAVWGAGHHGTPRTIDNFIQQLRAKLEDDPAEPKYFQTVRGVGYRFDG